MKLPAQALPSKLAYIKPFDGVWSFHLLYFSDFLGLQVEFLCRSTPNSILFNIYSRLG